MFVRCLVTCSSPDSVYSEAIAKIDCTGRVYAVADLLLLLKLASAFDLLINSLDNAHSADQIPFCKLSDWFVSTLKILES